MEENYAKGVCLQMPRKMELVQVKMFSGRAFQYERWPSPGHGGSRTDTSF